MLIEKKSSLKGELSVPADSVICEKALVCASLAKGVTEIEGFLMNENCLSTIDCFRKMHVGIEILPNHKVRVTGNGLYGLKPPSGSLNAGKSETTLQLILGTLAGQPFNSMLIRDESAQRKSIGKVVTSLRNMGANITGRDDGNLSPLSISPSNLKGVTHHLSITDMHIKPSLLIASLYSDGITTIIESSKFHDHGERMLNYFGADIKVDELHITSHSVENLFAQNIKIPGDISIAAFFITAGLLVPNSDILIKDVGLNPTRTGFLDVYKAMGAKISIENERMLGNENVGDIHVKTSKLKGITIDTNILTRLVDEIPIITVAAAVADGTTTIKGLNRFKIKDTAKLNLLCNELIKMGASIHQTDEGLIINGGKTLKGTITESYNDPILAMTISIAALIAENETMIRKAQILDIAYPEFLPILNIL